MTGTPSFLVFISLFARPYAVPLLAVGFAVVALSCALLLLVSLEGAISWQTEIDTGTSAAALNVPDTIPPNHHPPQRRAQSHLRRQWSVRMRLLRLQRLRWPARASLLRPRHLVQRALSQPLGRRSRARQPLRHLNHRSATFLIPAHGANIASG